MAVKQELLNELRKAHDYVKGHPFRDSLNSRYCKDYKDALYDMSEVWAKIIYDTQFETVEEKNKYRAFGEWIHNYRARLQMYYPYTFPMSHLDYYEQMLQVTHEYLDTGFMDRFYVLTEVVDSKGEKVYVTERYEYKTTESMGIESAILPRYLPVKWKLVENDQDIYDSINSGYNKWKETPEQINEWFEFWKKETKPVIQKLNEKTSDIYRHYPYKSAIYQRKEQFCEKDFSFVSCLCDGSTTIGCV